MKIKSLFFPQTPKDLVLRNIQLKYMLIGSEANPTEVNGLIPRFDYHHSGEDQQLNKSEDKIRAFWGDRLGMVFHFIVKKRNIS